MACEKAELDRALVLFRESKEVPPFSRISYFRGRIWEQKGAFKTAAVFLKHAVDLARVYELQTRRVLTVVTVTAYEARTLTLK